MKHLCKNCRNCERIYKEFGYQTECSLQRTTVLGKVKYCKHYKKKCLSLIDDIVDDMIINIIKENIK